MTVRLRDATVENSVEKKCELERKLFLGKSMVYKKAPTHTIKVNLPLIS